MDRALRTSLILTLALLVSLIQVYVFDSTAIAATIIGDGTSPSNKNVPQSSANNAVSTFTLQTPSGTDTVTQIVVRRGGTGAASDVPANGVKIYRDNNSNNEWDAGDLLLGQASFSGTDATFNAINIGVTTTLQRYLITYNIAASATVGSTLTGYVSSATAASVTNNDNADATLTITAGCTRSNPTVEAVPGTRVIAKGASATYSVRVTNNDTAACSSTSFTLSLTNSPAVPNANFSSSALSSAVTGALAPGAFWTTVLTHTATAGAANGSTLQTTVSTLATANGHTLTAGNQVTTTVGGTALGGGDGMLLKRPAGEICHSCHKTDSNAPNDPNSIKMHSAERLGSCSNPTYTTRTACTTNGGTWTTKWGVAGWGITGGQYGAFLCTTCHTSHNTRNIYLIKEAVTAPSGSFPGSAVDFRTRAGSPGDIGTMGDDSAAHSTSTRVCEVCHSRNKYHNYDRAQNAVYGGNNTHYNAQDCSSCHSHKLGFKASCDACHNSPPLVGKHAIHFGTASVDYGTTTIQSTAGSYGFSCGICHNGTHLNTAVNPRTTEVIFSGVATQDPKSPSPGPATYTPAAFSVDDPGRGYTFNYSAGTCTNIYCHGNYPGSGLNASPTFGAASTAVCGTCHGASNATTPNSGTHNKHSVSMYYGYECTLCHRAVLSGTSPASYTIADKNRHVSGFVDWSFDPADPKGAGGTYSIAAGTTMPSNGVTPNRLYGTCNNVYCHSNVQPEGGTGGPSVYANPQWGTTISSCNACHTGGHGNFITTGSHSAHLAYTFTTGGDIYKCVVCHNWYPSSGSLGCTNCHVFSGNKRYGKHANYQVDISFDTAFNSSASYNQAFTPGNGYSSCSNTYCHSNGISVSTGTIPNNTSPIWGSGALACNACHGNPPGYTNGSPKANSHLMPAHTAYTCNYCHNTTTNNGTAISSRAVHVNKAYNVDAGSGVSFTYSYAPAGGTCTTVSCHAGNATRTWGQ